MFWDKTLSSVTSDWGCLVSSDESCGERLGGTGHIREIAYQNKLIIDKTLQPAEINISIIQKARFP